MQSPPVLGRLQSLGEITTTEPLTPPAPLQSTTQATQSTTKPATQPNADLPTAGQMESLGLLSILALSALASAGVFKRQSGLRQARLLTPLAISPLAFNLGLGIVAYFVGAFAAAWAAKLLGFHRLDAAGNPTPGYLILVSAAAPAMAAPVLLLGLGSRVPNGLQQIGLGGRPIGRAVLAGVGYAIAVLPITIFVANATLLIYQHFNVTLDTVHPLLRSMGDTKPLERAVGAIAAVLIAPLAEELLFRAHLQTILRRPMLLLDRPSAPEPLPIDPAIAERSTARVGWWASVFAVVLTSLLFAAIHPAFSRPPIFVLSLILGLAYERTGNLWTPLAIHATFNGISTVLFLSTSHG